MRFIFKTLKKRTTTTKNAILLLCERLQTHYKVYSFKTVKYSWQIYYRFHTIHKLQYNRTIGGQVLSLQSKTLVFSVPCRSVIWQRSNTCLVLSRSTSSWTKNIEIQCCRFLGRSSRQFLDWMIDNTCIVMIRGNKGDETSLFWGISDLIRSAAILSFKFSLHLSNMSLLEA